MRLEKDGGAEIAPPGSVLRPLLSVLVGALLSACVAVDAGGSDALAGTTTRTYQADDSDFPNPERGFSRAWKGDTSSVRPANMSLVHVYFRLDDYKDGPLPEELLSLVRRTFDQARRAGIKTVPRFTYSFPKGEDYRATDAPLPIVLDHIDQLGPLLAENEDVIAFLEAGFIGAWGEWHDSTNGLDNAAAKTAILERLLGALPPSRAIVLRYARDKQAIFGRTTPIGAAEAFSGAPVARIGHHNDCFLASVNDWGTYRPDDPASLAAQKAYLRAENAFLPQGGETCNAAADAQPFIPCEKAVPELALLRWSQLNRDYHPEVLALWAREGCLGEISRRLGYRLRLTSASFPKATAPGGRLRGSIALVNDGFASPYNTRGVELILRDRRSKRVHVVPLRDDPRRWGAGEAQSVAIDTTLPAGIAPGTYDLLLNLPDPAPRLRGRPDYSIRLANPGSWEAATGYNALGIAVTVESSAAGGIRSAPQTLSPKGKLGGLR